MVDMVVELKKLNQEYAEKYYADLDASIESRDISSLGDIYYEIAQISSRLSILLGMFPTKKQNTVSGDVLRVDGLSDLERRGLLQDARLARKTTLIKVVQAREPFVCKTLEGDNIRGKAGDFIAIGVKGELYPIDREVFEMTYEFV